MRKFRLPHLFHRWHYRNPYSRTCKVCGRAEDMYSSPFGGARWEEMMTTRKESGDA